MIRRLKLESKITDQSKLDKIYKKVENIGEELRSYIEDGISLKSAKESEYYQIWRDFECCFERCSPPDDVADNFQRKLEQALDNIGEDYFRRK